MTINRIMLMVALISAEILATVEITMIYAALRFLIEEFGSPDAVGWTITGFLLATAVSAAICGRLGDMYGRKKVLLIVIVVSILGSLIAGFSTSLSGVVIGRTLQGSTGAVLPLCVGLLRANIDARALPMYLGVMTAIMTVSGGLGILLGGIIVDHLSWQWIFYITAMVGAFAFVAVSVVVPAGPRGQPQKDTNFLGGVLFAPGIACLMLALTKGGTWGWQSTVTLSLLAAGVALLLAWTYSETKARVPLLNIRLLLDRNIFLACMATIFLAMTWNQFGQVWSILLQQPSETGVGLGLTATMAGLVVQPQSLMAFVGGPLAGWCFVRYGARFSVSLGSLSLALAWLAAMLKHDSVAFILVLMVVMGTFSAYMYSLLTAIIANAAPEERTSEAIGMMAVMRATANAIGTVLVFRMLSSSTVPSPDGLGVFPDSSAYLLSMGFIAAGSLVIFVLYAVFYSRLAVQRAPQPV